MGRIGRRKGRSVRRNKETYGNERVEPKELKLAPHTFVMHRGKVGFSVRDLVRDLRKVMEPFTASSLKVLKRNKIKDFVSIAGPLHVTHFCILTRTDMGMYLRLARVPRGPTLSFKVHNYSLTRDVASTKKKQLVSSKQFNHSPLVVLNGFTGQGMQLKLMANMFQNMFPSININKVQLSNIQRCVLFNYDPTSKLIDFRHFAIRVSPTGISRGIKKMLRNEIPNLNRYNDISDFLLNPVNLSESEGDDEFSHVVLPQKLASRGNLASSTSAIKVVEIGPRLTLQLLKAEDGLLQGNVLYHNFISKTEKEIELQKSKVKNKVQMKLKRKRIQEENTRKKETMRNKMKDKCQKGVPKKIEQNSLLNKYVDNEPNEVEDNDAEWYKEEVGEEPDVELFNAAPSMAVKRKAPLNSSKVPSKKKFKTSKHIN